MNITVLDQSGNPLPGTTVTFTAPSFGGASVAFVGASTGSSNLLSLSANMAARPGRPDTSHRRPDAVSYVATAVTKAQGVASISAFNTPTPIQVQMNPSGLVPGVYEKNVVFMGPAGNSPFTVPVTLTVTSGGGQ